MAVQVLVPCSEIGDLEKHVKLETPLKCCFKGKLQAPVTAPSFTGLKHPKRNFRANGVSANGLNMYTNRVQIERQYRTAPISCLFPRG